MKNRDAFTLVELMIVVGIIVLLASMAIPNILRSKINANDAIAKATLKSFSTAAESYSLINGQYPGNITSLTAALPAYLNLSDSYCGWIQPLATDLWQYHPGSPVSGYAYSCAMTSAGYTFTAIPESVGQTGTTTYTIATGGVLTP